MKRLVLIFLLIPTLAFAYVSGMDDINPNIPQKTQDKLDDAITTYYQHPSRQKVETVLDIMNNSDLLRKKTAWPPMVGFLTVIFANNQRHLFDWMSLYDYNTYAQDVFVSALMHAKFKETALVFAQAHQWQKPDLDNIRAQDDTIDLKHLGVVLPGHIDTLWGAFFASGDPVYVDEIIGVLFQNGMDEKTSEENKKLAESTLRAYAPQHKPVQEALHARIEAEKNATKKQLLESILAGTANK